MQACMQSYVAKQIQRTAYVPYGLNEEVEEFLDGSDDFDSFSGMVRYGLRQTMQEEEYEE